MQKTIEERAREAANFMNDGGARVYKDAYATKWKVCLNKIFPNYENWTDAEVIQFATRKGWRE